MSGSEFNKAQLCVRGSMTWRNVARAVNLFTRPLWRDYRKPQLWFYSEA